MFIRGIRFSPDGGAPTTTAPAAPASSPSALPSAPPANLTATDAATLPSNISAPPVNVSGQLASTPPVTPQAPTSPTSQPADWTAHLSAEQRGWIQAKGVTDPGQLADMWKGMEKVVGTPKEQLAIIPKEIKGLDDYRGILARLGTPEKAEGYGLQADPNTGMTPEVVANTAAIFHKAGLTKDQANTVLTEWNQSQATINAANEAAHQTKINEQKQALASKWGAAHDQNVAIAKRAAATFGVKPEVVAAMEKSGSYSDTIEFFFNVGARMGEAKFVTGNPGLGLMTPEQASAEKAQLMADSAWRDSYLKGDAAKVKKMSQLIAAEMGIEI